MTQAQPNWIGYTLNGRYKLEAKLGSGGMAVVYKASDPHLQRDVAIKMIHTHLAQQPQFVTRFEQEAAALARLDHPNIVPVYDYNHDQGVYYMVLAYVAGGHLGERLNRLRNANLRLSLQESIDITITLCEAVAYAHQSGIIHRDLKPGNVLFNNQGQVYLTDFGVARLTENQQTMTVVGTPAYMSPEQVRGDQKLDQRCDIYSLGVMLYEMVGGRRPFEGNISGIMLKHLQEKIPDIRSLNPNLPAGLVAVIEKALAKEPRDRFQSASQMATALRTLSTKTTIVPPPAPPPPPPPEPSKRPIWIWLVGLVLLVAVAIGGLNFLGIFSPSEPPAISETIDEPTIPATTETIDEPTIPATTETIDEPDEPTIPVASSEPDATPTNETQTIVTATATISDADIRLGFVGRGMNCPFITEIVALALQQEKGLNIQRLEYNSPEELLTALADREIDVTLCFIDPDDRPLMRELLGSIRQVGSNYLNGLQVWANGTAKADLRNQQPCVLQFLEELNLTDTTFQEPDAQTWLTNHSSEVQDWLSCASSE